MLQSQGSSLISHMSARPAIAESQAPQLGHDCYLCLKSHGKTLLKTLSELSWQLGQCDSKGSQPVAG